MDTPSDQLRAFKAAQREAWAHFAPMETTTTLPAAVLVDFAQVRPGEDVIDVACGTGVVAVAAARVGARVRALDLSPVLVERARRNAELAGLDVEVVEGDVEALPYPDASADVVLSQFGHMFAPRPAVAVAEMLRVLRPGGRLAFSTWPAEMCIGQMFTLVDRYAPPPPPGVESPVAWGDPSEVRRRLGDAVADVRFERGLIRVPALSPAHWRELMETTAMGRLVASLRESDPARVTALRAEMDELGGRFFADNAVREHYLMTLATKPA